MKNRDLYKTPDTKALTIAISDTKSVDVQITAPGIIQFAKIIKVVTSAFLPDTLSANERADLSQGKQLELALVNLRTISENTSEEDQIDAANKLYSSLFLSEGNITLLESVIRDCFDLEASILEDLVLLQLTSHLVTLMSERVASSK